MAATSFAAGPDEPSCSHLLTDDPEGAAKRFAEGREAFARGKTEDAYHAFREAFEQDRCPAAYAANLGTVELVLGYYRDAAEHFARALERMSPKDKAEKGPAIRENLERARREIGTVVVRANVDGVGVFVDSHFVVFAPPNEVFVEPGRHVLQFEHSGYRATRLDVDVAKGESREVNVVLELAPAAPTAKAPERASAEPRTSLTKPILLVTGTVLATGGILVGVIATLAANEKSDEGDGLKAQLPNDGACVNPSGGTAQTCAALKDARESQDARANLAVGGFIVGGVAAIATVATYFLWPGPPGRSASVRVSPIALRDGGGIGAVGTF